jgi:hypothetical protein
VVGTLVPRAPHPHRYAFYKKGNLKQMIDALLKSNLVGVLIGGFITLLSLYSVELFKSWKEKKYDKQRVYYQSVAQFNMFKRYAVLAAQMDLLNDYHKCQKTLIVKNGNKDDEARYHEKEAQRRLLQFEEFQTKRIEIEGNLFSEIAKYYTHVGKDAYLYGLIKQIEDWEHPRFSADFDSLDNIGECKTAYNNCDQKINSIDKSLEKLKKDCLIRIKDKLKI